MPTIIVLERTYRERELLVLQVEGLVLRVRGVHEVNARADVGTGLELERERVAGRGDTVGARVVGAVERAVGRASGIVGAERGVPGVTYRLSQLHEA